MSWLGKLIPSPPVQRWHAIVMFTCDGMPYGTFETDVEAQTERVAQMLTVHACKASPYFDTRVDFSIAIHMTRKGMPCSP